GLAEEVAHAGRAHADEHLDEVRAADAEKRHLRLAGDGLREERLASSRRPHTHPAARTPPAELLELLRVLQELDDLDDLVLRLVDPRHVGERDARRLAGRDLGAAAAARQDGAARPRGAEAAEEEEVDHEEEDGP